MRFVLPFTWAIIAIMGAVALAFVTGLVHPNEKVNGLWLVVAAACIHGLTYPSDDYWSVC